MKADFASQGFGNGAAGVETRQYGDHQVVYRQGEDADGVFRVQRGHVKLTIAGRGSRKAVTALLSAGDCFGEGCLAGTSLRASTATSIKVSIINRVSKQVMASRLSEEPGLAPLFISYLLLRMGRVEADLVSQLVNSSDRRLARLLVQLSGWGAGPGHQRTLVSVDQGTLAQMVGTTRSRVSYFMNQFRKRGMLDYNGSVRVHKALLAFLLRESPKP
jgi:CRP/FNR family transcriptional regulator, cyclic AMP receptor protein